MPIAPIRACTMPVAPSRLYLEADVMEELRTDPQYAAEYLNAVLEDGDQQELARALHRIAQAFGRTPAVAEPTQQNAKALYNTLSQQGNPELKNLTAMLGAMGMRLAVQPMACAVAN